VQTSELIAHLENISYMNVREICAHVVEIYSFNLKVLVL